MKTVETVSIFVCLFLVMWSAGDGAPQWRPQGRFGKRFSNSRSSSNFMTALESGSLQNTDDSLESLFLDDNDLDLVNNNNNALDEYFNNNNNNAQSGLSSTSSRTSSKWPTVGSRICIETALPGVFRCHRRDRTGTAVVTLQD